MKYKDGKICESVGLSPFWDNTRLNETELEEFFKNEDISIEEIDFYSMKDIVGVNL